MKAEIKKEFSMTFLTERFWVYFNDRPDDSFATKEEAVKRIGYVREVLKNAKEAEVVFSEEF